MIWRYRRDPTRFHSVTHAWAQHRPIFVTGPTGVGKTALARDFAASIGRRPLWIVGTPAMRATPLAAIAATVPVDDDSTVTDLVDQIRIRLSDGAMVIVESAENLDTASASVVARLFASVAEVGVVTASAEIDAVLAGALGDADCELVAMASLDLYAVTELVQERLGGPLAGSDAVRIHRLTGGNPLILIEVIEAAIRTESVVETAAGTWVLHGDLTITDDLRQVGADRMASATASERRLIDLMSLCQPLPRAVADYLGLADGVGRFESDLVVPLGDTLVPGHALYPEIRRADVGTLERRLLAGELVSALEAVAVSPVARLHAARLRLEHGLPPDLDTLGGAAATAFLMGDLPLAERLARTAVEEGAGLGAQLQLSRARSAMGRSAEAVDVLSDIDADSLDEDDLAAFAVTMAINRSVGDGDHPAALRILDKFELRVTSPAALSSFAALRALAHVNEGNQPDALWWARRAQALVSGARLWTALGEYVEAETLRRSGESRRPVILAGRALDEATGVASLVGTGARRTLVQALMSAGDLTAAVSVVDALIDSTLLQHIPRAIANSTAALVDVARGRFGQARRRCEDALASLNPVDRTGLGRGTAAQLAEICALTGDVAGARQAAVHSARATEAGSGWLGVNLRLAGAFARLAEGEIDAPSSTFREVAAVCVAAEQRQAAVSSLHWSVRLGDVEAADRLISVAAVCDGALTMMQRDHAVGVRDADPGRLASVSERFAESGFLPFAIDSLCQAATLLRATGDRHGAEVCLDRVADLCERCEAMASPAVRFALLRTVLARRELEVFAMAGSGVSALDIATRLGLQPATVRNVLSAARRKVVSTSGSPVH